MQGPATTELSEPSRGRPSARGRGRRGVIALSLVTLIGLAAYVSTRPLGGGSASNAFNADAPVVGALPGLAIGQAAPDFVRARDGEPLLVDLEGRPVHLGDFGGKPLWIVFWATWCTPCLEEAGDIRAAFHAHGSDGLQVLAIDIQEPAAAVRAYAHRHDLDYTIGLDPTAAVKALYGNLGLPSHIFLDGDGVIRDRYLGQLTAGLMELHLQSIIGS
jgi:cytochrome c biogenesis protein CcmG/thiol:disulfide interchange protein DsbE